MCILITVVDDGGRLFGVTSMSSNDDRISSAECRMACCYGRYISYLGELSGASPRHAAVNNRRPKVRGLGSGAGGGAGSPLIVPSLPGRPDPVFKPANHHTPLCTTVRTRKSSRAAPASATDDYGPAAGGARSSMSFRVVQTSGRVSTPKSQDHIQFSSPEQGGHPHRSKCRIRDSSDENGVVVHG